MTAVLTSSRKESTRELVGGHDLGSVLTRFLWDRPPLDDVCRLIVAILSDRVGARGATVFEPSDTGYRALAHWDSRRSSDGLADVAASELGRPSGVVRKPRVRTDASGCAVAEWPLGCWTRQLGVLSVTLEPGADHANAAASLEPISEALAIYLGGYRAASEAAATCGDADGRGDGLAPSFTMRQMRVLQWLESGLTVRQIASRIGFSDSTVRAETLVLYRGLGVHDRHEAVAAARLLGLLSASEAAQHLGMTTLPFRPESPPPVGADAAGPSPVLSEQRARSAVS